MKGVSGLEPVLGGAAGELTGLEPELGGALRPPVDARLWRALLSRDLRRIRRSADAIRGAGMRRRYVAALADVVRQEQGSRRYSERIRRSALEALSVIADPDDDEALQTILAALADANWEIRQYAAWALGQLANPRAVDALTEALNDASPYVCFVAADALQRLRSSRVRAAPGAFRYTES